MLAVVSCLLMSATVARTETAEASLPPGVVARIGSPRLRLAWATHGFQYTPDGSALVRLHQSRRVDRVEVSTGVIRTWESEDGLTHSLPVCLSGNKDRAYCLVADGKSFRVFLETVDTRTGKRERKPVRIINDNGLHAFAMVPDGPRVVATAKTGWCVVDLATNQIVHSPETISSRRDTVASSADGRYLALIEVPSAFAREEKKPPTAKALVLDLKAVQIAARCEVTLDRTLAYRTYDDGGGRGSWIATRAQFSADGQRLFMSFTGHPFLSWKWKTEKQPRPFFVGPEGIVWSGWAISPDDRWLSFVRSGHKQTLFSMADKKVLRDCPELHTWSVVFSPDGSKLTGLVGSAVVTVDVATGKIVAPSGDPPYSLILKGFANDGKTLVSEQDGRRVEQDWRSGKVLATSPVREHLRNIGARNLSSFFAHHSLSPDGKHYLYVEDDGACRAFVLDAEIDKPARTLPVVAKQDLYAAFTNGGRDIVTIQDWKLAQRWRVSDFSLLAEWKLGDDYHSILDISPDGRLALLRSGKKRSVGERLELLDLLGGSRSTQVDMMRTWVQRQHFTADSRRVFLAQTSWEDARFLSILDRARGRVLLKYPCKEKYLWTAAPHGRYFVASQEYEGFSVIETATGQPRWKFTWNLDGYFTTAITPDSRFLAVSDQVRPIDIFDAYRLEALSKEEGVWSPQERRRLWQTLAGPDAKSAFEVIGRMIRNPDNAVAALRERLKPMPPMDPKQVDAWLDDLGSDSFQRRQVATEKLTQNVHRLESRLRREVSKPRDLETKRRLEKILSELFALSSEQVLDWRALEVLEVIGPKLAGPVIESLVQGDPDAPLTVEAKMVADRWRSWFGTLSQ